MNPNSIREIGWQTFFDAQVEFAELESHLVARVAAHHGSQIVCLTESAEISVPTSLVEPVVGAVAVGDWLLLQPHEHRAKKRLERKSLLSRKAAGETVKSQLIAANVDTVFVVSSCNQDFNPSRLERYLALVLESQAVPVVVLTKSDLCDDAASMRQLAQKLHPHLIVETLDARDAAQTCVLDEWCGAGQTVALLGSSGVGKSTLANALSGLDLRTEAIRVDDDKGRHTTTARSMHKLIAGGWLIDNPGMRELQLADCEQGVADLFDDVLQIAQSCRFRNCNHQGDAGCAVESAVESGELEQRRLTSFLKLRSEQARNSTSLAERREKERKTGQLYKKIITDKRNRRHGS